MDGAGDGADTLTQVLTDNLRTWDEDLWEMRSPATTDTSSGKEHAESESKQEAEKMRS